MYFRNKFRKTFHKIHQEEPLIKSFLTKITAWELKKNSITFEIFLNLVIF